MVWLSLITTKEIWLTSFIATLSLNACMAWRFPQRPLCARGGEGLSAKSEAKSRTTSNYFGLFSDRGSKVQNAPTKPHRIAAV